MTIVVQKPKILQSSPQVFTWYCLVLLLILPFSQNHAAYFQNLTTEDGLSQGTVFSMAQDAHGFLWIGTADGLNRYDGIQFIHFSNRSSDPDEKIVLTDNEIDDITTDKDGNLWISTRGGLTFMNTTTYKSKHYIHDPSDPNSLPNNKVRESKFDSQGYLWIATRSGISRFNPETEQFKSYIDNQTHHKCSPLSFAIDITSEGHILVGNANGLCKFDTVSKTFTFIEFRTKLQKSKFTSVSDIIYNKNEGIWLATPNGLFLYNHITNKSTSYFHIPNDKNSLPHNQVIKIAESDNGFLWIATAGGVAQLHKVTGKFTNFKNTGFDKNGLKNNEIFSIFIDHSGLIWVGTNGSGLNIYNPRQQMFKQIKKEANEKFSLSNSSVWEINKAYGFVWVGTSQGLNRYNPLTGEIKQYLHIPDNKNSLPHGYVLDIDAGVNRDLWVVTWSGISHFFIDDERFENYQREPDNPATYPLQSTLTLHHDKKRNQIWIGSASYGVSIYNRNTNKFTSFKYNQNESNNPNDYTTYIYQSLDEHIWLATNSGIIKYNPDTQKTIHLPKYQTQAIKDCYAIKQMKNGNLLFASSNGLHIIDPNSFTLIKTYTQLDGLEDDYIYGVEIDNEGFIWVSTNLGLTRINPKTNEVKNFDTLDGLQGNEFNGDASFNDGEYIYFGGFNGVNYFKPEQINTNEFTPPVMITKFSIHNKPLPDLLITQPLQLSYKDSFFSIEFSALDFTNPKKNQYAYMLEGFDNDWIYNKNRNFASYTNLDGGHYTFHIKAANKYGIWNEHGASIPISISPPFWRTIWFRIIATFLLLMLVFTIYALRVKGIKERNIKLKQEVKNRTIELEEQKKNLEDTLLELGETKDALIDAAHKAGMADTATGVIHNIGNILNSVNTSAGMINDILSQSAIKKLLKANKLLENNLDHVADFIENNPKGLKLPPYYLKLGKTLQQENTVLKENALLLLKKITSITEVITAQQRYVHGYDFIEELSLADIIDDTMMLQAGSIGRHEIIIKRFFDKQMPRVPIQKIKLVQILINLYKNAKESMDENKKSKNILTLELYHDNKYAYIKVADTGLGINNEHSKKIFSHGFTTKRNGYGFGLHSCANYMTEMHGKIWAESDGPGCGATFFLQFPLKRSTR